MGKGLGQTFLQGKPTGGQQVFEKMFNITTCEGNENENHNDRSPHTCQNGCWKTHIQRKEQDKEIEKLEPLVTVVRKAKWCSHYGKQHNGSSKN